VFLTLLLWGPLFIFSSANPFQTVSNNVEQVQMGLSVRVSGEFSGVYPLFEATSANIGVP
jgi:hypothetical protein